MGKYWRIFKRSCKAFILEWKFQSKVVSVDLAPTFYRIQIGPSLDTLVDTLPSHLATNGKIYKTRLAEVKDKTPAGRAYRGSLLEYQWGK